MRFINFLILKLATCLSLGIILGHFLPTSPKVGIGTLALLILLLLTAWLTEKRKLVLGPWFGVLTLLIFINIGYLNLQWSQLHFQPDHYSHSNPWQDPAILQIKISELLKPDAYHHKYFGEVIQLNTEKSQGKLLISIRNDACYEHLKVDELILISSRIAEVLGPLNPHQFDYREYLRKQGVYHQITVGRGALLKSEMGRITLKGFSERIRSFVSHKIASIGLSQDAASVTRALVLGERRAIDKELYESYAAAGAIHMLAVSGLHVGILFLLFTWALKPLEWVRFGKQFKVISIVALLWGFAILAGLSPSVVRAVTMFSCFALAGLLNRSTNGFNTLALSYFILLLLQPNWLFHIGFQMSYLAVFFILWLQPKIYGLFRTKNRLIKYFWGMTTVTLSAQIGVAPLSLFYFHQFPGLFLLTNLVVLPFLGILLVLGLIVSLWASLGRVPDFIVSIYNGSIGFMNQFIEWVASQQSFLFQNVPLSLPKMILLYVLIISLIQLWKSKSKTSLFTSLVAILILLGFTQWERSKHTTEALIVFQKSRTTLMGYKNGTDLTLFTSNKINPMQYPLKDYITGESIFEYRKGAQLSVFEFKGKRILRLDSLGVYPNSSFDIVILTESPKIHLDRLLDSVQPKLIIADGNNYKSYVMRWKKTCVKRKLPFHYTGEKGAYILK